MRIRPEIHEFIKLSTGTFFPGALVYLFGSRVDDLAKGGDIDLMIVSPKKIDPSKIREFRVSFFKQFGWQKLDIVNFTRDENPPFRQIINEQAVLLT